MTTDKTPIPTDLAMTLRPAQNGGWAIEIIREAHGMPTLQAAFTNPADMLTALREAFGGPQSGADLDASPEDRLREAMRQLMPTTKFEGRKK